MDIFIINTSPYNEDFILEEYATDMKEAMSLAVSSVVSIYGEVGYNWMARVEDGEDGKQIRVYNGDDDTDYTVFYCHTLKKHRTYPRRRHNDDPRIKDRLFNGVVVVNARGTQHNVYGEEAVQKLLEANK